MRYCLIIPAFKTEYFITGVFPTYLTDINFFLLVCSTVIIAAAGYIINDYFDIQEDEINKPGKNIVGKSLSKPMAKNLFFILSSVGVAFGFYVAVKISKPVMGLIPLFSAFSLWMYSSHFKKRLLSGNIIVSLLCALTILIVGLYEPQFYKNFTFLIWFAIPAFILTLIRELIKDMEDINGDEHFQCKTVPIVLGISKTKVMVLFLILLLSSYLSYILYEYFYANTVISFWYLISLFLIPIAGLTYLVITSGEKKDFYYASLSAKIIMLGGIFSMYFFWFYFLK